MIILDHNISEDQAEQLRRRRVHFRQIGFEVGRPEWDDQQELLRYLHNEKQSTFFTRDLGFFRFRFCHPNYCIVVVIGSVFETASLIRKLLRCSQFKTRAKRRGKVIKVSSKNAVWWEIGSHRQQRITW